MYLNKNDLYSFTGSAMRHFEKNELHVTRIFNQSVLILMISGVLRFREDGKDIELKPGEYYIQREGIFQEGILPCDEPTYFYIHFKGEFSEKGEIPIQGRFNYSEIANEIQRLEQLYVQNNGNMFLLNGLLYTILGHLNNKPDVEDNNKIQKISDYIYERYLKSDFRLNDIAKHFMYSREYIIKLFKNCYGVTPYRYITSLRINYAKQMFLSTTKCATEVYLNCGYSDYSVFYKNFIKTEGVSPKEWIKNNLQIKFQKS